MNPAKHCQVGDNLLQEEEGHPVIERSSYNNLYFPQLRDLWDLLHVYVAPSQASEVAGEGLYVRRKVPRWVLLLGLVAFTWYLKYELAGEDCISWKE